MVLPVLDLMGGKVVRGVAGKRSQYLPVVPDARPSEVARGLLSRYRSVLADFYAADLDALQGGRIQYHVWREMLRDLPAMRLWMDAGIANGSAAQRLLAALDSQVKSRLTVIVASETLTSWNDLAAIVSVCGAGRLVFSLDLVAGRVRSGNAQVSGESPLRMVQEVAAVGINRVIVLDVASVGIRQGLSTLELCRQILALHPGIQLLTGGGVRTVDDLARVRDTGCIGALIATALHDGTIKRGDLARFLKR
jgi:phosphoribosylformimino-5-aminoimidazole carboxamide ribotide isomerase